MRHVCSSAAAIAVSVWMVSGALAQNLTITSYHLVSEERVSRSESYFTYRADLMNTGPAREAVTATVSSSAPNVRTVAGQTNIHFSPVPANGVAPSRDTFTLLIDRSVPFDFAQIQWSFTAPVAHAGFNQTTPVGATVTLNGSGSTNPSGIGQLSYSWAILSRPPASKNPIANPNSPLASFTVDSPGAYVFRLTVSNGAGADAASVAVNTRNSAPVANAGANQTVPQGALVRLDGSTSSDVDGDQLTYSWQLISVPQGSAAALLGAATVSPTFVADRSGSYIARLIVSDGLLASAEATVTVTTTNTRPVANAGPDQQVMAGALVQLNGAGSTDVDRDALTYRWTLNTVPAGSTAVLNNPSSVNPTFTADRPGDYVAQLIVNDGKADSDADTVRITTTAPLAPTANAGSDQSVPPGATVTLNGSGSDPQALPLTYVWSLTTKPAGSAAVLTGPNTAKPSFVADVRGTYVAQLIVNNGHQNSPPDSVSITTENTKPVANPGPNQNVISGNTVLLNGSASSDADGDALTFNWSFLSRPASSAATLTGANTATPSFLADAGGTYVVQLTVHDGVAPSAPVTVTISASTLTLDLTPNPLNLSNAPKTLTINISPPAPVGGVVLKVAILDPAVASAPAEVVVPVGATGANVQVSPVGAGTTTITASAPGYRPAVGNVIVTVPGITLTLADAVVGLSRSITGTVTVSDAVPPSGVTVALNANPADKITLQPALVVIPGGSTTGTFQITGAAIGNAVIAATASGYTSGTANIAVQSLGTIILQSGVTVGPGQSVPIQVTLVTPAPAGGATIALASSDPTKATVTPSTVNVPQGATVPVSQPQVQGVSFGSATITATAPGFTGASEPVQVRATLAFSPPASIVGANGIHNLNLTLSAQAPAGGLQVNLTSSAPQVATVPATVTIPQGQSSLTVPLNALGAGETTISATSSAPNVVSGSAQVSVVVFGSVVLPSAPVAPLGQSVPFPVSLSENAPAGGVTVTLAVADPTKASLTTTTVAIPAGAKVPAQQPQLTGTGPGTVAITASAPGFGAASTMAQVTATLSFTSASFVVKAGFTQTATLNLSGPAPSGGLQISLQSSDPTIVTVPPNVTIPAGASSAGIAVIGVAPGTATIRASHPALSQVQAEVTVDPNGPVGLPASLNVAPGQTVPLAITLPAAAPAGGVVVSLSSSDTSKVSLSATSVQILAGQTTPATQPSVTGVSFGTASITATAPNFAANSASITVGASLSFPAGPLAMLSGSAQNVTLTLSAPAPAGGLTVGLQSSNSAVASVSSSATIPAGATTVSIPIQAGIGGTAAITASTTFSTVTGATLNVAVEVRGGISGPALLTVPLGQTAPLAVALPTQAPAGGVSLSVLSSDPAIASVQSATASVPSGQTQPSPTIQVSGLKPGTASITVSGAGYLPVTIPVRVTATLAFEPNQLSVATKETRNLVLRLSAPAPAGGLTVNLVSANPTIATVPPTVIVPAGGTDVNVPVTGVTRGDTTVQASGVELSAATATVAVTQSVDILLPQSVTVAPGESAAFPVSLAQPSTGTTRVDLQISDDTKARFSISSVFFNPGETQPQASPRIEGLAAGDITVTALSNGLNSATATVRVGYTISFANPTVQVPRATTVQAGLRLTGSAPAGGLQITLSSDNTNVATVPASVTFAGGATTVNVPVTGAGVGTTVIRATGAGLTPATLSVTVIEPGTIVLPTLSSVHLNSTTGLAFTLSSAAPAGGVDVTLSSSDAAILSISAATVHVPGGATSVTVPPSITGVNVGDATVTASAPGYLTASKVIKVNATIAFVEASVTFSAGVKKTMALRLSTGAPQGGITINLVSSNTSVVTTPPTANFYWDGSDPSIVLFQIDGVAAGTAQLRASGINIPEVVANITVAGPLSITTVSLPNGTVNTEYNDGGGLAASGGTAPYTFALAAGTLPPNLVVNPNGRITGVPTNPITATPLIFRVTDSSASPQTAQATLNLTVDPPAAGSIAATGGTPQGTRVDTLFANGLTAIVRDAGGNPLQGVTVAFESPASGPSATFPNGSTATTDASGSVSITVRANATPGGPYIVTARVTGVASSAQFSLTNIGDVTTLAISDGGGQSAEIDTAFGKRLAVIARDAAGTAIKGATVTFTLPGSGPSGAFANGVNTAVTDDSGIATSAALTANSIAGSWSVTASANGRTASFSLTNTHGPAASMVAVDGSTPQSALILQPFGVALAVTVRDSHGNAVPNVSVTFTAPANGASGKFAGSATVTTGANGVATAPGFTANSEAGSYKVQASAGALTADFALTNIRPQVGSIVSSAGAGQEAQVDTNFGVALAALVRDINGNAMPNTAVTFAAPVSPASGAFAGGGATATVNTNSQGIATAPVFRASTSVGVYAVTAEVTGLAQKASFALTNIAGPPAAVVAVSGGGQETLISTAFPNPLVARVVDAHQNPVRSVAVTFRAPSEPDAASAVFGGNTVVLTDGAGIATSPALTANSTAGAYAIRASVPGLPEATFPLTNKAVAVPSLTLPSATIGKGLQVPVQIGIPAAVATDVEVTVTSLDSSKVLLSKSSALAGSGTLVLPIAAGQTAVTIFVQALADTSTVNVRAEAAGYNTGTGSMTLGPSGFVVAGPNGLGVPSFTTPQGSTVTLTIHTALLNASGGFVASQSARGGVNLSVGLAVAPASVGSIQPATATILGGDSSTTATFRALIQGGASITASHADFAQGILAVTVSSPSCIMPPVTVGRNLQTTAQIELAGVASALMPVSITSADPGRLLLSTTATGAGSPSITVNIPMGGFRTPQFYLQALSDTGTVDVTAGCGSLSPATGTVSLARSGFMLLGPVLSLTTGAPNATLTVSSVMLDSSLNFVENQPIRPGFSANVSVTSSLPSVGTITTSPVTLGPNVGFAFTEFDPLSEGTTILSINTPAGFSTPAQGTSLTATIGAKPINVSPQGPTIGKNLQQLVTIFLGEAAPAGGLGVTVNTASPSLRFGASSSDAGTGNLVINIPGGGFQATVYLNALADAGSATYTVSAPGYVTKQDTVQFAPSGVVIYGMFGYGWPLTATVAGGNQQVIAEVGVIDAISGTWMFMPQPVRGGLSLTAPLRSTDTTIGTVPAQIVIPSGETTAIVNFTPKAAGQTRIEVTQPAGLTAPSQYTTVMAQVN